MEERDRILDRFRTLNAKKESITPITTNNYTYYYYNQGPFMTL